MTATLDEATLLTWGSATLHEACASPNSLPPSIRPAWAGATVVGRAYPVVVAPGDNLALHWAIAAARPGEVIVADAGDAENGHCGEVMAVGAQARGIAGLVIAGGVRDTEQLAALGFPAFSSSVTVRGTAKRWAGLHAEPIVLGQATIARGDIIVGDADGVVSIPQGEFEATVARAAERIAKEDRIMQALRHGSTTLDEYALRSVDDRTDQLGV